MFATRFGFSKSLKVYDTLLPFAYTLSLTFSVLYDFDADNELTIYRTYYFWTRE